MNDDSAPAGEGQGQAGASGFQIPYFVAFSGFGVTKAIREGGWLI